jgi:hypothetical protein
MSSANPNDFLSAYYDRETAPTEEPVAKALAQSSPEANRELKDYQRLSRLIQELPRLAAPPEFATAVMQRAERESLIPLDPIPPKGALAPAKSGPPSAARSRRRWILVAATSGAVAAVVFVAVSLTNRSAPTRPHGEFAVREVNNSHLMAGSDLRRENGQTVRTSTSESEGVVAFSAAKDGESAAPAAKAGASPASSEAAAPLGLFGAPVVSSGTGGSSGKQPELALMLPANLKTAKVGDVVEALQQDGKQVAVVRLTVVNQVEGLDGVQSLLVRNTSRTLQNVDEIKRMRQQFSAEKSAEVSKGVVPSAPGDLICVYVEGSRDEMLGVLQGLQNESHIREAELTNTISFTTLEEYASRAVPAQKQSDGRGAANQQTANGPVIQGSPAAGSQRAVSLPASTVDKILSARQPTATDRDRTRSKSAVVAKAAAKTPANPSAASYKLDADKLQLDYQNDQKARSSDSTVQGQTAVAARRGVGSRSGSRALSEQGKSARQHQEPDKEVAAAQKSFQIFFVITDQPLGQSTRLPALRAAKAAAPPVANSAPNSASAQRTSAAPLPAKSASPNKAP